MFVELNMVVPSRDRDSYIYDEEVVETEAGDGEDDGMSQVQSLDAARQARAAELTTLATVNPAHIKNFYRRKKRSDGTQPVGVRINFSNGSGMAVTDTYDEVKAKLASA
jgi:hypothetical protein